MEHWFSQQFPEYTRTEYPLNVFLSVILIHQVSKHIHALVSLAADILIIQDLEVVSLPSRWKKHVRRLCRKHTFTTPGRITWHSRRSTLSGQQCFLFCHWYHISGGRRELADQRCVHDENTQDDEQIVKKQISTLVAFFSQTNSPLNLIGYWWGFRAKFLDSHRFIYSIARQCALCLISLLECN